MLSVQPCIYMLIHNFCLFFLLFETLLYVNFQYMLPYGSSESNKENVCSNTCNSHCFGACDDWPHTFCSSLGKYIRQNLKEEYTFWFFVSGVFISKVP